MNYTAQHLCKETHPWENEVLRQAILSYAAVELPVWCALYG